MPERVEVRAARWEDRDRFLDLVDALAHYERLDRPTADARERLIRDGFGESPLFTPFVALLDGEMVGYAIVFPTYSSFLARPTLYLEDVFVLPEARGGGVGRAIFRVLAQEALRRDCGRMEWVVLTWNRLAIDFYDRMGAESLDEWKGYRLDRRKLETLAGSDG